MLNRRSLLATVGAFALPTVSARASDRVSDFKPFEKGDIFVAATIMDHPTDDHMGTGRVLQFDPDLNLKGTLYTKGTKHLVSGLTFAPDGTLWGFASGTPAIVEIGSDGAQKPVRKFSDRAFGNVAFGRDGTLYFGEQVLGTRTQTQYNTTVFNLLPGRDVIGDGWVFQYSADGDLLNTFETDVHGGVAGFLGVTSTVITDDDTRLIYLSETGNRILQYDLANDRQMPDLRVFEPGSEAFMVVTMAQMADGNLLVSTGTGVLTLDQSSGEVIRSYDLGGGGWASCIPSLDGRHFLVGNFFTGELVKVAVETGDVVARTNVGQEKSLSGVAQFAG